MNGYVASAQEQNKINRVVSPKRRECGVWRAALVCRAPMADFSLLPHCEGGEQQSPCLLALRTLSPAHVIAKWDSGAKNSVGTGWSASEPCPEEGRRPDPTDVIKPDASHQAAETAIANLSVWRG